MTEAEVKFESLDDLPISLVEAVDDVSQHLIKMVNAHPDRDVGLFLISFGVIRFLAEVYDHDGGQTLDEYVRKTGELVRQAYTKWVAPMEAAEETKQ